MLAKQNSWVEEKPDDFKLRIKSAVFFKFFLKFSKSMPIEGVKRQNFAVFA